jgi:hypothetical protein
MLGVLVIGLSIHPMLSSMLALPWVLAMTRPMATNGGFAQDWHWTLAFIAKAVFFTLCVLFGLYLACRASKPAGRLFPEVRT